MLKIKILLSIVGFVIAMNASSKIIEVNQLFNKTLISVKEENISTKKNFYGNIEINEEETIDIVTRYNGFITNLYANKTYMKVKKDDLLFSVYSNEIVSVQEELQISKKINNELYKSSLDKLISLDVHKNEINRIKNSKRILKNINVFSPINAIVMKKNVNNKSAIKKGNTILQLSNIEKLWFVAEIYQKDFNYITLDMSGNIYIDGIKKPIVSFVDYIYPIVDPKTKTFKVRFLIENKNLNIFPNMFAQLVLQTEKKIRLTLPNTAVLNKGNKYYVFKPISDMEFKPVEIKASRISSKKYEIFKGVKANEKVINNALFLLDSDAITNALYETEDDDW